MRNKTQYSDILRMSICTLLVATNPVVFASGSSRILASAACWRLNYMGVFPTCAGCVCVSVQSAQGVLGVDQCLDLRQGVEVSSPSALLRYEVIVCTWLKLARATQAMFVCLRWVRWVPTNAMILARALRSPAPALC